MAGMTMTIDPLPAEGWAPGTRDACVEAVRLDDVSITFPPRGANSRSYTAIKDVSLQVSDGEFVSIVGPTGCGKSTVLNLVAGLLTPSTGTVSVFGEVLAGLNRMAGYLFQSDAIMPWRTALYNVVAGLEVRGVNAVEREGQGREWLARVGLRGKDNFYPHQLSGGMRRRVALAQMLIVNPRILLMDEPFSALDIQTRQLMENELLDLWTADRKSVLFITHDLEEAISMSDRVVVLSAGPQAHPIGEYKIDLPRPRDVAEIRLTPRFLELHSMIWDAMRGEVLKGYEQNERS
jgi:NitT/TauT family transport system ATP-binding protein